MSGTTWLLVLTTAALLAAARAGERRLRGVDWESLSKQEMLWHKHPGPLLLASLGTGIGAITAGLAAIWSNAADMQTAAAAGERTPGEATAFAVISTAVSIYIIVSLKLKVRRSWPQTITTARRRTTVPKPDRKPTSGLWSHGDDEPDRRLK